jgi:LacI family transcriptional regulator
MSEGTSVDLDGEVPPEIAARVRRRGGAATIYDIADAVGLNASTVSRALSSPGRVNPATEARIREAAAALGYRINPMARSLPTVCTTACCMCLSGRIKRNMSC